MSGRGGGFLDLPNCLEFIGLSLNKHSIVFFGTSWGKVLLGCGRGGGEGGPVIWTMLKFKQCFMCVLPNTVIINIHYIHIDLLGQQYHNGNKLVSVDGEWAILLLISSSHHSCVTCVRCQDRYLGIWLQFKISSWAKVYYHQDYWDFEHLLIPLVHIVHCIFVHHALQTISRQQPRPTKRWNWPPSTQERQKTYMARAREYNTLPRQLTLIRNKNCFPSPWQNTYRTQRTSLTWKKKRTRDTIIPYPRTPKTPRTKKHLHTPNEKNKEKKIPYRKGTTPHKQTTPPSRKSPEFRLTCSTTPTIGISSPSSLKDKPPDCSLFSILTLYIYTLEWSTGKCLSCGQRWNHSVDTMEFYLLLKYTIFFFFLLLLFFNVDSLPYTKFDDRYWDFFSHFDKLRQTDNNRQQKMPF